MSGYDNPDAECILEDAKLFGRTYKGGEWYTAYLIARNVKKDHGGGANRAETPGPTKVSANHFAELSGSSAPTVGTWYDVWNFASENGVTFVDDDGNTVPLPHSDLLLPGHDGDEWSMSTDELERLNEGVSWRNVRADWKARRKADRDTAAAVAQVGDTTRYMLEQREQTDETPFNEAVFDEPDDVYEEPEDGPNIDISGMLARHGMVDEQMQKALDAAAAVTPDMKKFESDRAARELPTKESVNVQLTILERGLQIVKVRLMDDTETFEPRSIESNLAALEKHIAAIRAILAEAEIPA